MNVVMRTTLCMVVVLSAAGAFGNALDHLQSTDDIGLNKVPHLGQSHILVITSRIGVDVYPQEEFDVLRQFFATEGGPGTFREWWQIQSRGLYDPIPYLVEPVLFNDVCPIPDRTLDDCEISITDFEVLASGAMKEALTEVLRRVRDEQQIDLSLFDINGRDGPGPDGFFDGVLINTDIYRPTERVLPGMGLPLAALGQDIIIPTTPRPIQDAGPSGVDGGLAGDGGVLGDGGTVVDGGAGSDAGVASDGGAPSDGGPVDGGPVDGGPVDGGPGEPTLALGILALFPPAIHEFGHNLGFIDLYGGPNLNGVMGSLGVGISAYSRLQVEWGDITEVTEAGEYELSPALQDGEILRFGSPPRYMLVENRGGSTHGLTDLSIPGLYFYSVDEEALPEGVLGFLDIFGGDLYLPNRVEPYLNASFPLDCQHVTLASPNSCVLFGVGSERDVQHLSGEHFGFYIENGALHEDGTITVHVWEGEVVVKVDAGPAPEDAGRPDAGGAPPPPEPEGCGSCNGAPGGGSWAIAGIFLASLRFWRRRRRSGRARS